MLRVYTASKVKHSRMWKSICDANGHFIFHARWLKHHAILETTEKDPEACEEFWLQDEQDVRDADVVLVYAEEDEHLRGALVEAGMAIAYGVPVIVVGDHSDYGTWKFHPGVMHADNIDHALELMAKLEPAYRA